MPRLFNRPRGMPRFHQGRMFNRLTGQRAPRLYSGNRQRRASHSFFGTQVSPYGAGGGGRGQAHAAHAGRAGNVYAAMLNQSRRGGTNLGMRTVTPGYRGTRMHRGFRQDQASIKRDFGNRIRQQKRLMRQPGADKNTIRAELARLRGRHRTERRAHAQGIQTKWSADHNFNLGGGRRRQWKANQTRGGTALRNRTMLSPRMGINVGQDSRTGNRFIQGINLRRQQGGGMAGFNRAESRNMRIANRMNRGKGDRRLYGIRDKQVRAYAPTHADFTRGGRRSGLIRGHQGHWNRGRNAGRVMRPYTNLGGTFLPSGRTIQRNPGGHSATHMAGSFRIPQTNRPMTSYEMSRMGSARGPHPQRRQANRRQFNPSFHDYRADRF